MTTKNLGLVQAIHSGTTAPNNTKMLWYDENSSILKIYNSSTTVWDRLPFGSEVDFLASIVANLANNSTENLDQGSYQGEVTISSDPSVLGLDIEYVGNWVMTNDTGEFTNFLNGYAQPINLTDGSVYIFTYVEGGYWEEKLVPTNDGDPSLFLGIIKSTDSAPASPVDGNWGITQGTGIYTNFDNLQVNEGVETYIKYDLGATSWYKEEKSYQQPNFLGVATPSTTPKNNPRNGEYYIIGEGGDYINFFGTSVTLKRNNQLSRLEWNGTQWNRNLISVVIDNIIRPESTTSTSVNEIIFNSILETDKKIIISEIWDFGGATIDFTSYPNMVIEVEKGGMLKNVTLVCNDTWFVPKSHQIFDTVTFEGTPRAEYVTPEMFGAQHDTKSADGIQAMFNFTDLATTNVLFSGYEYILERRVYTLKNVSWIGKARFKISDEFENSSDIDFYNPCLVLGSDEYYTFYSYPNKYKNASTIVTNSTYNLPVSANFIKIDVADDISSFKRGDTVFIWSDETYNVSDYKKGDILQIFDVDTIHNIITFTDKTELSYDAINYPVSMAKVEMNSYNIESLSIEGIWYEDYIGSGLPNDTSSIGGFHLLYGKDVNIKSLSINNVPKFPFMLFGSREVVIDQLTVNATTPEGSKGYHVEFLAPNKNITFNRFDAYFGRHVIDAVSFNGTGLTSNFTVNSGTWMKCWHAYSGPVFNPHGGIKDVTINNIDWVGVYGRVLNEYNPTSTYNTGDMVFSDVSIANSISDIMGANFISLIDNNIGNSLLDPLSWKMIWSYPAYQDSFDVWQSGISVSDTTKIYIFEDYVWECSVNGITDDPSISNSNWSYTDEFNGGGAAIRTRWGEGFVKINNCRFKHFYHVVEYGSQQYTDRLEFNNCEFSSNDVFLTLSSDYYIREIKVSNCKFDKMGILSVYGGYTLYDSKVDFIGCEFKHSTLFKVVQYTEFALEDSIINLHSCFGSLSLGFLYLNTVSLNTLTLNISNCDFNEFSGLRMVDISTGSASEQFFLEVYNSKLKLINVLLYGNYGKCSFFSTFINANGNRIAYPECSLSELIFENSRIIENTNADPIHNLCSIDNIILRSSQATPEFQLETGVVELITKETADSVTLLSVNSPEGNLDAPLNSICIHNDFYYKKTTSLGTLTGWILKPKTNYTATSAPTVNDDDSLGYGVGSKWYDTVLLKAYELFDNTTGSAVWVPLN